MGGHGSQRWSMLSSGGVLAMLAGMSLLAVLLALTDGREVLATIASSGWAVAAVLVIRIAVLSLAGLGWALILPGDGRLPKRVPALLRFVREAVNTMMPVAQIGGEIVGARVLTFFGTPGTVAAASIVIDVFMQATTQLIFTIAGLLAFAAIGGSVELSLWLGCGLAAFAAILGLFYWLQRHGRLDVLDRFAGLFGRDDVRQVFGRVQDVQTEAQRLWSGHARMLASGGVHLAAWFIGVLEVWAAMSLIGTPITLAEALVLESVGNAARSAAFLVPAGMGIQEGGYVAAASLLGIPPDRALATSLIKRVPDLLVGVAGLVGWHWLERRRRAALAPPRDVAGLRGAE